MAVNKEELVQIFGPESVLDDESTIESYSRDESLVHPLKPRFVTLARNADQVQKLIALANKTLTPIVPVSSGPPHFRGDTIPSVPGAIVVDLSALKKIMHIDARNRIVLVEPGVTYPQLQPELARSGLRLSPPLLPRSNKSVVASLLEREPRITPRFQWAMLEPLRCTEVVWGDGEKMATGDTAGTDHLEEEWKRGFAQISGAGPAQTDFFKLTSAAQGSMGIVTWASIKCEVLPQVQKLFLVPSDHLEGLIDLCYEILRIRFADELFIMNGWGLANILGKNPGQIEELAGKIPAWALVVGIAGRDRFPAERVAYQQRDIGEMVGKRSLQMLPEISGVDGQKLLEAISGSSPDPYWKLAYAGACQEVFFLTTLDKTPEFVTAMNSVAEAQTYPTAKIGIYIQPVQQGASCHLEFDFPYQRNKTAEQVRIEGVYAKGSQEMLKRGAYYSRPYGLWSQMAFNRDFRTTQVLNKIKDIFDPNHIMNPGKLCF